MGQSVKSVFVTDKLNNLFIYISLNSSHITMRVKEGKRGRDCALSPLSNPKNALGPTHKAKKIKINKKQKNKKKSLFRAHFRGAPEWVWERSGSAVPGLRERAL